jgi:hypothetical protein
LAVCCEDIIKLRPFSEEIVFSAGKKMSLLLPKLPGYYFKQLHLGPKVQIKLGVSITKLTL